MASASATNALIDLASFPPPFSRSVVAACPSRKEWSLALSLLIGLHNVLHICRRVLAGVVLLRKHNDGCGSKDRNGHQKLEVYR